jgi:hypothetical protein
LTNQRDRARRQRDQYHQPRSIPPAVQTALTPKLTTAIVDIIRRQNVKGLDMHNAKHSCKANNAVINPHDNQIGVTIHTRRLHLKT